VKIAIVHDYLKEIGGAERVLMTLKEIWPEADVYTAYKFPQYWGHFRPVLEIWNIRESWGAYLPFLPKFLSYYTVISPLFFTEFDLSEYDVVIVSATGGYFPNGVKIGEATRLVTYCHTPPRFLYGFPTASNEREKWYWKPVSNLVNHILRIVDFNLAQRPHVVVANSKNVANRIRKFYRREATVIYPPVEAGSRLKTASDKKGDYFLMVTRVVGGKGIELACELAKSGQKIVVAGRAIGRGGEELARLIKVSGVEYIGEVTEEKKLQLLAESKGFLALAREEDFGITPVEAMAAGTPVIAYDGGGYRETVIEGKTGVLFDKYSLEGLKSAIDRFDKTKWEASLIRKSAARFSREKFKEQMVELVEKYAGAA